MKTLNVLLSVPFFSLVLSASAGCSSAPDDAPGGSSEDEVRSSRCNGRVLSEEEIAGHLREAGFPASVIGTFICTAKYESRFCTGAVNDRNRNGTVDRGLFQINSVHLGSMRGCPRRADDLFDPETNARCAYAIYRAQGVRAWYGYRSHKAECDKYPAPRSAQDDDSNDEQNDQQNEDQDAGSENTER